MTINDTDYQENKKGDRIDGHNLINDWIEKMSNKDKTHKFIWNSTELYDLKPNQYEHILG